MTILGITASSKPPINAAFNSIASASGNGSSTTITFSSIPSTYKHLQLRCIVRGAESSSTANQNNVRLEFNTGTSAYRTVSMRGQSGIGTDNYTYTGYVLLPFSSVGNTAGTGQVQPFITDIFEYASTTKNKSFKAYTGASDNSANSGIMLTSGYWQNTSAINEIRIINNTGSAWTTLSSFALYGIKG